MSLGEKYTAACLIAGMKEKGVVIKKDTTYRDHTPTTHADNITHPSHNREAARKKNKN